jgi:hypothetical protein
VKCDNCLYQVIYMPTQDSPYGEFYCCKDHWDGGPFDTESIDPGDPTKDPWGNCPDFKPPARQLIGE